MELVLDYRGNQLYLTYCNWTSGKAILYLSIIPILIKDRDFIYVKPDP